MPRFSAAFEPPPTIEGLTATATGAGVELEWNPSTLDPPDFVAYHVDRSIAGAPFVRIATLPDQASTTFVDYAAPLGVTIVYRVVQEAIDYESAPADATTMVDACEFWLVLATTGQQIGFEIPNVEAMSSTWPQQLAEFEPLGRNRKLIETGELLGEESTVSAVLLESQANVARQLRAVMAAGARDDLLWKTPYGDVSAVVVGSLASERGVGGRQTLSFRTIAVADATD